MKFRRYGRTLSLVTGRLGLPVGLHVVLYLRPRLFLGISGWRDEDDGNRNLAVGVLLFEIQFQGMRYLTKKERLRKEAELAELMAPRLVEEVERYLEDPSA